METNNQTINEIEQMLNGYKEKPIINPETQPKSKRGRKSNAEKQAQATGMGLDENSIPENPVISGSLLILMIDLILPNLICFANNKYSKQKIKASKLQMTAKQREELEPIADRVAQEMALKANPMTVLIISLLGIYGVNFMTLKSE